VLYGAERPREAHHPVTVPIALCEVEPEQRGAGRGSKLLLLLRRQYPSTHPRSRGPVQGAVASELDKCLLRKGGALEMDVVQQVYERPIQVSPGVTRFSKVSALVYLLYQVTT
jgi:hypothetical protein